MNPLSVKTYLSVSAFVLLLASPMTLHWIGADWYPEVVPIPQTQTEITTFSDYLTGFRIIDIPYSVAIYARPTVVENEEAKSITAEVSVVDNHSGAKSILNKDGTCSFEDKKRKPKTYPANDRLCKTLQAIEGAFNWKDWKGGR